MKINAERTEQKLGFDRIRSAAESMCSTSAAKIMAQEADFCSNTQKLKVRLNQTDEMRVISLLEKGFPDSGYVDTAAFISRLENTSYYLDLNSIIKLRTSLETLRQIQLFFKKTKDNQYPYLKNLVEPIILFPEISRRIDSLLDRFGEIKDNASEDLAAIRKAIKEKEGSIARKINSILKNAQQEGIIDMDASVSIRDGRMLLPVTASNKRKVPGFVLDESATGKTLYIEPLEIVELNNIVKELHFAEQREIIKILAEFSDFLRPYAPELLLSAEILAKIDFIWAKARLAASMGAGMPVISDQRELSIRNARHPLLEKALKKEGKEVVPLTLSLNGDKRILLISGPNAGGKSVCLKTVGLLQYMLQCGFLIPAGENSEMTLFDNIFIDIGDEQSLDNDLSTYSSHLTNMKAILEGADERSLVLIDEFGAGTEPTAGGAIAEAILGEIERRGCFGIITTHYSNLKFYASSSRGVLNGGMQFDVQNIKPLFKLETGTPGSSFAFELARKIGLPEDVVKKAEERAGTDFVDLERHLKKIAKNRRAWEERLAKIKSTDRTLENITDKYQKELSDIQELKKTIINKAKAEADQLLAEANKRIESTIKEIRESQAEKEKTKIIRKSLTDFIKDSKEISHDISDDNIARKMELLKQRRERRDNKRRERDNTAKQKGPEIVVDKRKEDTMPLKKGDKVRIKGGELVGEVLGTDDKTVNIAIGSVISRLAVDKVERISNNEYSDVSKKGSQKTFSVRESQDITNRRLEFKPSIDIRGERLEQALEIVTRFIDDAIMVGVSEVRILHGKGNGILREEIRKYIKTMGGVSSFRDENIQMGGSGITIVKLED
jgi:DNA mismatch repair protein MutS2